MIPPRPPSARRQTALAFAWVLLCAVPAFAREFAVRQLTDAKGNARSPAISESGEIVWQGYTV